MNLKDAFLVVENYFSPRIPGAPAAAGLLPSKLQLIPDLLS